MKEQKAIRIAWAWVITYLLALSTLFGMLIYNDKAEICFVFAALLIADQILRRTDVDTRLIPKLMEIK